MPQPVMIQTEPMATVSARKNTGAADADDKSTFSAQFNQQLEQGQAVSKRDKPDNNEAASKTAAEQDIAADDKKLPSESKTEKASDEAAKATGNDPETAENDEADNVDTDSGPKADHSQTAESAEDNADAVTTTVLAAAQQTDVTKQPKADTASADKAASQPASDPAKTLAAQQIKDSDKQPLPANKTEAAKPPVQQTAAKTISETIDKLNADETQRLQKTTPNLAAALKQLSEDNAEPPKLRADIMDALQRQQHKTEPSPNLRNMIAAQSQQSESKPALTMPLPLVDRARPETGTSTSPSGPTSLSGLISTPGSAGGGQALSQATLSLPVQPNMQNPAWSQVMSSRVVYMAKEGVQQAELRMNPANLGPVEVRLHVQNDQASVTFLAQQGTTREALEQALPRLRESFAESGLQLANAEVGEQQQQQQQQHEQSEQANDSHIFAQAGGQDDDIDNETVESVSSEEVSVGLSLYA